MTEGTLVVSAANTTVETAQTVRGINGTALIFGAVGNSSAGPTRFEAGSLVLPEDLSRVKLLLDHDATDPLGYLTKADVDGERFSAEFTVADGERGDMVLAQARDKRRDGLSVGCQIIDWHMDGSTVVVTKAALTEVSLVSIPAFADARITEVRASVSDELITREVLENEMTAENIENVETVEAAAEAATTVEAPTTVTAAAAPVFTAPKGNKDMNLNGLVAFTKTHLQASSAATLTAALTAALTDVTPVGSPGVGNNVPQYLAELWEASNTTRPLMELIGTRTPTALRLSGFQWVNKPVVAKYAGNKADVPSGPVTRAVVKAALQRFAGAWDIDRVYVDLPGGEDFIQQIYVAAMDSYRQNSEKYVAERLLAEGGVKNVPANTNIVTVLSQLGEAFAASGASLDFIQMSADYWAQFVNMKATDAPFWLQSQGGVDLGTAGGNAGGLSFRLNSTLPAGTVIAGDRRAVAIAEKDVKVTALDIANGGVDLGVFGYVGVLVTDPASIVVVKRAA